MSRMRRHRTLLIHPLILLALQSAASGVALAQEIPPRYPRMHTRTATEVVGSAIMGIARWMRLALP